MPAGRPPFYKTVEEMDTAIDNYFVSTKENNEPLTITGLALWLGFTSRQAVLNYEGKPEFVDAIKRAKLQIENYNEKVLYDRGIPTAGVIFNLANNYKRQNKQTIDTTTREANPLKDKLDEIDGD